MTRKKGNCIGNKQGVFFKESRECVVLKQTSHVRQMLPDEKYVAGGVAKVDSRMVVILDECGGGTASI